MFYNSIKHRILNPVFSTVYIERYLERLIRAKDAAQSKTIISSREVVNFTENLAFDHFSNTNVSTIVYLIEQYKTGPVFF